MRIAEAFNNAIKNGKLVLLFWVEIIMMFQVQILHTEKLPIFMMGLDLLLTWLFKMLLEIVLGGLHGYHS